MMFLSFTFVLSRKGWDTFFFTSLLFHFIYNDTYWDGLLEEAARRFEMNVVTKSDTWTYHTYLDTFDYSWLDETRRLGFAWNDWKEGQHAACSEEHWALGRVDSRPYAGTNGAATECRVICWLIGQETTEYRETRESFAIVFCLHFTMIPSGQWYGLEETRRKAWKIGTAVQDWVGMTMIRKERLWEAGYGLAPRKDVVVWYDLEVYRMVYRISIALLRQGRQWRKNRSTLLLQLLLRSISTLFVMLLCGVLGYSLILDCND